MGAPQRVGLRVGEAQIGDLRLGVVQDLAVPVVARAQADRTVEPAPCKQHQQDLALVALGQFDLGHHPARVQPVNEQPVQRGRPSGQASGLSALTRCLPGPPGFHIPGSAPSRRQNQPRLLNASAAGRPPPAASLAGVG
jgi:hypothetical protein